MGDVIGVAAMACYEISVLSCGRTARRPGRAIGLADHGRANLRHFDRDARLAAAESTGSCPGEVAAGSGGRRNACGQRGARPRQRLAGATAAAWPPVALVGSYELLMMIIHSAAAPEQSAQPRETHDLRHERASLVPGRHAYSCSPCHFMQPVPRSPRRLTRCAERPRSRSERRPGGRQGCQRCSRVGSPSGGG